MSTPAPGLTPLAQLCLAATAAAAARGLRVLYLDSTGGFSANRLLQLLTLHNAATTESVRAALAAVRAVRVSEVYAALAVLDELLRGGPAAAPALLVCDSASALLSPLLNHKLQQGRSLLLSLGGGFKAVADELRVAVLITNHTVSGRDREQGTLRPALGEAWKSQRACGSPGESGPSNARMQHTCASNSLLAHPLLRGRWL